MTPELKKGKSMLWEKLYLAVVWFVLLIGGALGSLLWLAWITLLPVVWREKSNDWFNSSKDKIHDFSLTCTWLRPVYLKAHIAWHAKIRWRRKYYWLRLQAWKNNRPQPSTLARAVFLLTIFLFWLAVLYEFGKFPDPVGVLPLGHWKDWFGGLKTELRLDSALFLTALGLPSLFVLWAYRDSNALLTLENQRKDTNLKDFQQLQMWACGIAEDFRESAEGETQRTTLRIAAIHQLERFLDGEHGESFVQPTFQLLRALAAPPETLAKKIAEIVTGIAENDIRRVLQTALEEAKSSRPEWQTHVYRILLGKQGIRLRDRQFDWSGSSLPWANLYEAFLPNVWLEKFQLQGSDFIGAELPGASFYLIESQVAAFNGTQLQGTSWHFPALRGANFENAQLQGSRFYYPNFQDANLAGVQMQGAVLTHPNFQRADLDSAKFEGATLKSPNFQDTNLRLARFHGASLTEARFENAHMSGAKLCGATLKQAQFRGANLTNTNIQGATLDYAMFQNANLRGIVWDEKTNLERASYNDFTQFGEMNSIGEWVNCDKVCDELRSLGLRHEKEPAAPPCQTRVVASKFNFEEAAR